jgi:integrase
VAQVKHHAALPWREIGAFMEVLRGQKGVAVRALEFAILTAARTGEVLGVTWGEVDLANALWTIPGARMKAGREHRVPLSQPAVALLGEMAKLRTSADQAAFIFPGAELGRPLSNMALLMALRRMGRGDLTAHGFRSTFRDWVGEATGYPADVAEAALAHVVGDKTVAAYARGDLFEKRRALMAAWAEYCAQPAPPVTETVVPLRRV